MLGKGSEFLAKLETRRPCHGGINWIELDSMRRGIAITYIRWGWLRIQGQISITKVNNELSYSSFFSNVELHLPKQLQQGHRHSLGPCVSCAVPWASRRGLQLQRELEWWCLRRHLQPTPSWLSLVRMREDKRSQKLKQENLGAKKRGMGGRGWMREGKGRWLCGGNGWAERRSQWVLTLPPLGESYHAGPADGIDECEECLQLARLTINMLRSWRLAWVSKEGDQINCWLQEVIEPWQPTN